MRWSILTIAVSIILCGGCGSASHSTASIGAGLWTGSAARWTEEAARWAEDSARMGADDASKLVDDAARREAEKKATRLADKSDWQGADEAARAADTEVAKRTEDLKSKIEDSIDLVGEGGCAIVEYAGMEGVPPSDDQVHYMVEEADLPKYFLVESEGGLFSFDLVKRKQVKKELIEINHLVWANMYESYSTGEPDDYSDILYDVITEAGCEAKDALGRF